ncbi:Cna B-type domain-containing protein [Peptoniphilus asaccharolyticus]
MKKSRFIRNILMFSFIFLLVLSIGKTHTYAMENNNSIKVKYILENTEIKIYKIANILDDSSFEINSQFDKYDIDMSIDNYDLMDKLSVAKTLESYIKRDSIAELDKTLTDGKFEGNFSGLSRGIYLLVGNEKIENNIKYIMSPVLLKLDGNSKDLINDFVLKYEKHNIEEKETIKAYKLWNDSKINRPESIEIQLLQDGKIYDTTLLNKANNWKKIWDKLPSGHTYEVVEKNVPDNYKVLIKSEGSVFKIINTIKDGEKEPPKNNTVPQTGQLWWPIPLLLTISLAFILIGIRKNKKHE